MNNISPVLFGRSFGQIVPDYVSGFGKFASPVFHILTLILIIGIIVRGNKMKTEFTLYYLINYIWIFLCAGIYMSYRFYLKMGLSFLVFWGPIPILLLLIIIQWTRELKKNKNDLSLTKIPLYRWIVVPVIFFGFWYPAYSWGQGFQFGPGNLLFSSYGLMPCPTTMVVLGILTLKYPDVNKGLFYSLTLFAILVGSAQTFIGYVPDYPLAVIGYYALLLISANIIKSQFKKKTGTQA